MIETIKKKRRKVSAVFGQNLKDAKPALLESRQKIDFQNSELESIKPEPALIKKSEEIKVRNPHLENLNANSALSCDVSAKTAPTFTQRLNAMIAAGVSFDVGPDNFQAFGASERENIFLRDNSAAILCTLQQMFLQKHLFDYSPELLEAFKTEVIELSAVMTDGGEEVMFEAVVKVCTEWIANAIERK